MPGRPRKIPSYCRHKASGQAVVRIDGTDVYLGLYGRPRATKSTTGGSPNGSQTAPTPDQSLAGSFPPCPNGGGLTIVELIAAFWPHAKTYYVKNGKADQRAN